MPTVRGWSWRQIITGYSWSSKALRWRRTLTSCPCMTGRPARETCGHGESPPPALMIIIVWQPSFMLVPEDRKIKSKALGVFFFFFLAVFLRPRWPRPAHSTHPTAFPLPLIVCQQRLCCFSPQQLNKRKKKIHYGSGLRGSSPVQTSGLRPYINAKWSGRAQLLCSRLTD